MIEDALNHSNPKVAQDNAQAILSIPCLIESPFWGFSEWFMMNKSNIN